nr:protein NRDE2 homolog isoform X1 [Ipomoea batatas]
MAKLEGRDVFLTSTGDMEKEEDESVRQKQETSEELKTTERSADARKPYEHPLFSSRKPDVASWASSSAAAATNAKDYYFDSRGDRDNLAFGCLYKYLPFHHLNFNGYWSELFLLHSGFACGMVSKDGLQLFYELNYSIQCRMDVARYKLRNTRKTFELNYCWRNHNSIFDPDGDVDAFDSKLRAEGRYWSAKYAAVERHKNLKRTRIFSHARPQLKDSVDFIPLIDEGSGGESVSGATVVEESWEDEIFFKTKEFNKMTRERPHDEKIWLDFADFQDKVASMQPHKGARLQILEKKISILEKATELNPDKQR